MTVATDSNRATAPTTDEIVLLVLGGQPVWEYEEVKVWVGPDGHMVDAHVVELGSDGALGCMTQGCSTTACNHKTRARLILTEAIAGMSGGRLQINLP